MNVHNLSKSIPVVLKDSDGREICTVPPGVVRIHAEKAEPEKARE